ncbi:MAG: hypothetical protein D6799_07575, partial [Bacteroidetes bacterium]
FLNDDGINEIIIDNHKLSLSSDGWTLLSKNTIRFDVLSNFVGIPIDGLLGYDFFIQHDIIIDLINYEMIFDTSSDNFDCVDINFFMNTPIVNFEIQGIQLKAIFDTGSMYSIINSNFCDILSSKNESIKDYNPVLGSFDADLYRGDIIIGNTLINNCTIACSPQYDIAMNMMVGQDINGFLGMESLNGKRVFLSYKNQRLGIR